MLYKFSYAAVCKDKVSSQDAPDVVPDMPQTWEGEGKADFI